MKNGQFLDQVSNYKVF